MLQAVGDTPQGADIAAEAQRTAHTINEPYHQGEALVSLVRALCEIGNYRQAEVVADTATEPRWQAAALTTVIQLGDRSQATRIAADTEATIRAIADVDLRAKALAALAGATAAFDPQQPAETPAAVRNAQARRLVAFLGKTIAEAYTPTAIDFVGRIYAQNNGQLYVLGH